MVSTGLPLRVCATDIGYDLALVLVPREWDKEESQVKCKDMASGGRK